MENTTGAVKERWWHEIEEKKNSYRSRSEICMISSYILYKYCISLYYIYTFLVVDLDNICSRQILYKKNLVQ